eukprot:2729-Heterococcus_DN1.PRE.2
MFASVSTASYTGLAYAAITYAHSAAQLTPPLSLLPVHYHNRGSRGGDSPPYTPRGTGARERVGGEQEALRLLMRAQRHNNAAVVPILWCTLLLLGASCADVHTAHYCHYCYCYCSRQAATTNEAVQEGIARLAEMLRASSAGRRGSGSADDDTD